MHLLKMMWNSEYQHLDPYYLKQAIGGEQSQYDGQTQQDANEFLKFMLKKLDDDLNRVQPKLNGYNTLEMPNIQLPPDDVLKKYGPKAANILMEINMLSQQSIVQDMFVTDFRSTLVCQRCKESKIVAE